MASVCKVDACDGVVVAKGYCWTHYNHARAHGHPWIRKPKICTPCSVTGCGKRSMTGIRNGRPLCQNHGDLWRLRGRLEKIKPRKCDDEAAVHAGVKACSTCKNVFTLDQFYRRKRKATPNGSLFSSQCRECTAAYKRQKRGRSRADVARDLSIAAQERGALTKEDRALTACVRMRVRERINDRLMWAFDNWQNADPFISRLAWLVMDEMGRKPWSDPRLSDAEKYRMRYAMDRHYQINERLRRSVTKARKRLGIQTLIWGALKHGHQSPTVERQLGFTIEQLRRHLERQFTKGMTWDRFMKGEIHIDHIVPVVDFNVEDPAEFVACWSLPNLRPLWARHNLEKGARRVSLL